MLECQKNPMEAEEVFRFDEDEHFLQFPTKSNKTSSPDFRSCSASAAAKGQDTNHQVNNFNFDPCLHSEEILCIRPQKNFTFDIMSMQEGGKPCINRTKRSFDLSSMYQSLVVGSSEEEDEFEPYDYSASFEDMTIEGLRIHLRSCFTCGVHWHEEQASLDCSECGGYALERPCPDCDGQCHATFVRNLDQSHSLGKARWTGTCSTTSSSNQSLSSN